MPFEEFGGSAYPAMQCAGEQDRACRRLDAAAFNNFIFDFFLVTSESFRMPDFFIRDLTVMSLQT
jgi:hypothetical protein